MSSLTPRQREVYDYLRNTHPQPTYREMADHFQISSPNGVMCHLRALEKKGLIRLGAGKSRSIEIVGSACCPTCGRTN